jgi:Gram-negative bacterial TonB protein C-terminal
MRKTAFFALAVCLFAPGIFADEWPNPVLDSAQMPRYPAIAETAHVEGDIEAEFALNQDGSVASVRIVSGPPLLAGATEDNIRTWKFGSVPRDGKPDRRYKTTFSYHFSGKHPKNPERLRLTVTFISFERVEITKDMGFRQSSY